MLVPTDVCLRLLAVPVERHGSVLVVAFADPSNVYALAELEERTHLDIEIVVSCETAVRSAIARLHRSEP
jgi:type IV pilus assembly protein PilB